MNIYLDMDDVVADWMGYARKYLKTEWQQGEMVPEKQWTRLKDDQRMYSKLDLKEGAIELVDWCKAYQQKTGCGLFFLTAVPHNNDMPFSFHDKVEWAQKYFPGIPVFFGPYSHDKWIRCTSPDDLLIDDRRSNNDEWKRQGGRAFLYKNWPECKLWLEAHLGVL
jgi:5'(3')-deoxyribonucleotidase